MKKALLIILILLPTACAYRFGLSDRKLPGGYNQVAIPVFKNATQVVGVEVPFTNSLIRRFARSQVAEVTDRDTSPLLLEGSITDITSHSVAIQTDRQLETLPKGSVLTTEYRVVVTTELILKRRSDDKVIWQGRFTNERVYPAPRIGQAVLNSANSTYNHSVRMETLARLADEMMDEVHDRMTENF